MKNIADFQDFKKQKKAFSMITCYDYCSACIVNQSKVDCVLVGDSVAMVVHGASNTIAATLEMMSLHTQAVARGITNKWIVADLPFLSYRKSIDKTMHAVEELIRSGAHGVKLEGWLGNGDMIEYIIGSGVPVMGHLGLTPQHIHALGGFKVQGKTLSAANQLIEHAKALEGAGCYALVLECVPKALAAQITAELSIPTIGIGAGNATDAQVLVWHDVLGLSGDFNPRFVRCFSDLHPITLAAINDFAQAVRRGDFPTDAHSYLGAGNEDLAQII
jgi:3-methyl-2-oxobutanoate hydroxymethyltransferase